MSEMVLVVPVIALTTFVLVGILFVFRKYLALRDRLDAEMTQTRADGARRKSTERRIPAAQPHAAALVTTRRHAA